MSSVATDCISFSRFYSIANVENKQTNKAKERRVRTRTDSNSDEQVRDRERSKDAHSNHLFGHRYFEKVPEIEDAAKDVAANRKRSKVEQKDSKWEPPHWRVIHF